MGSNAGQRGVVELHRVVSLMLLNCLAPQRSQATKLILSTFLLSTSSKAAASFFRGATASVERSLPLPDLPGPPQIMPAAKQPTRRSARLSGTRGDVEMDERRLEDLSGMKVVDLKEKLRLVGELEARPASLSTFGRAQPPLHLAANSHSLRSLVCPSAASRLI